jgi:hypothetical protein
VIRCLNFVSHSKFPPIYVTWTYAGVEVYIISDALYLSRFGSVYAAVFRYSRAGSVFSGIHKSNLLIYRHLSPERESWK